MAENYENETCEGCVSWETDTCGNTDRWGEIDGMPAPPGAHADSPICDLFRPDLDCRQTRALESITAKLSGIEMNTRPAR